MDWCILGRFSVTFYNLLLKRHHAIQSEEERSSNKWAIHPFQCHYRLHGML